MEAIEKDDRKEHVSHIKPRLTAEDQKAVEEIEGDGGKAYRALGTVSIPCTVARDGRKQRSERDTDERKIMRDVTKEGRHGERGSESVRGEKRDES